MAPPTPTPAPNGTNATPEHRPPPALPPDPSEADIQLTNEGDLFCGDLIYNFAGFSYIDDLEDFNESMNKLRKLEINFIYPGHGKRLSAIHGVGAA